MQWELLSILMFLNVMFWHHPRSPLFITLIQDVLEKKQWVEGLCKRSNICICKSFKNPQVNCSTTGMLCHEKKVPAEKNIIKREMFAVRQATIFRSKNVRSLWKKNILSRHSMLVYHKGCCSFFHVFQTMNQLPKAVCDIFTTRRGKNKSEETSRGKNKSEETIRNQRVFTKVAEKKKGSKKFPFQIWK